MLAVAVIGLGIMAFFFLQFVNSVPTVVQPFGFELFSEGSPK